MSQHSSEPSSSPFTWRDRVIFSSSLALALLALWFSTTPGLRVPQPGGGTVYCDDFMSSGSDDPVVIFFSIPVFGLLALTGWSSDRGRTIRAGAFGIAWLLQGIALGAIEIGSIPLTITGDHNVPLTLWCATLGLAPLLLAGAWWKDRRSLCANG